MGQHKTNAVKLKLLLGATSLLLATSTVDAQKMYKVVDENGRVSYQDKPPETDDASVEERHISGTNSRLSLIPPSAPVAQKQPVSPTEAGAVDAADGQGDAEVARPAVAAQPPSEAARQQLENTLKQIPAQPGTPTAASDASQSQEQAVQTETDADYQDGDQTAAVPESRPADPDGQPGAVSRASEKRNAANAEIKILGSGDAQEVGQRQNAKSKSGNSRGRRPAAAKQQAPEKRLTTDELAEIARSLEQ